jgi:hypothetical protein
MVTRLYRWWTAIVAVVLSLAAFDLVVRPSVAPMRVALALATASVVLVPAWIRAKGTALRPAVAWCAGAIAIAMVSQIYAIVEPLESGRAWTGHTMYLATLGMLAAGLSVLGARRSDRWVWAVLMSILVCVMLIPWLESGGLGRPVVPLTRLRLEAPWTLFFGILALAVVSNFVPTRYGPAAVILGLAFGVEYLGLTRVSWPPAMRGRLWSIAAWGYSCSIYVAACRAPRLTPGGAAVDRLWQWFRDHWGLAWGLRVRDRFNESARALAWPLRLTWKGVVVDPGVNLADDLELCDAAAATLAMIVRRFADEERVAVAARAGRS